MTSSPTVAMLAPPTTAATNYHCAPPQPSSQAPPPIPLQGPPPLGTALHPTTTQCNFFFFSLADKQHFHFYLSIEGQF